MYLDLESTGLRGAGEMPDRKGGAQIKPGRKGTELKNIKWKNVQKFVRNYFKGSETRNNILILLGREENFTNEHFV